MTTASITCALRQVLFKEVARRLKQTQADKSRRTDRQRDHWGQLLCLTETQTTNEVKILEVLVPQHAMNCMQLRLT